MKAFFSWLFGGKKSKKEKANEKQRRKSLEAPVTPKITNQPKFHKDFLIQR